MKRNVKVEEFIAKMVPPVNDLDTLLYLLDGGGSGGETVSRMLSLYRSTVREITALFNNLEKVAGNDTVEYDRRATGFFNIREEQLERLSLWKSLYLNNN
ncbi:MAG: hypothetical protein LBR08_10405 [Bacteroidales bacterium]|jgi:hypothetical protein|nr:hypothetical protein [Bacteroidales bacterium]